MSEEFDPVKHYFLQYIDPETGKMRDDAPAQAKKDYRKWQREEDPEIKALRELQKGQQKK